MLCLLCFVVYPVDNSMSTGRGTERHRDRKRQTKLVSKYFEPSQPKKTTSGLKTMFNLSPTFFYPARKLSNHKLSKIPNISPDKNYKRQTINLSLKLPQGSHANKRHKMEKQVSSSTLNFKKYCAFVNIYILYQVFFSSDSLGMLFQKIVHTWTRSCIKCFYWYWLFLKRLNDFFWFVCCCCWFFWGGSEEELKYLFTQFQWGLSIVALLF